MPGPAVSDLVCAALVYAYVGLVIFAVERLWRGDRATGRKILHISIGNVVFLLWLPTSPWTGLAVAGSFVVFSLLITPRALALLRDALGRSGGGRLREACRRAVGRLSSISVSGAGNEFGLVYYCIAFTVLAFAFFDRPVVVAAGILPLAYGDGMGAVVGLRYGAHGYRLIDRKSVEGSLAVFAASAVAVLAGLAFYGVPWLQAVALAAVIGAVSALVEAAAPWGLDNLAIPACAAAAFLLLGAAP